MKMGQKQEAIDKDSFGVLKIIGSRLLFTMNVSFTRKGIFSPGFTIEYGFGFSESQYSHFWHWAAAV